MPGGIIQRAFPATLTRQVVLGAACWALSIVFFADQAVAQAASTRPYSMATNLVSDLGVTACGPYAAIGHAEVCSPLHLLVNGTFVVAGLLHAIGAIATRRAWPPRRLSHAGLGLIALAGTGLTLAGLLPENVQPGLHALAAVCGIVALDVGMTLLGLALLGAARGLGTLAVAAGIAGLLGTVIFLGSVAGVPGGAAERVAVYPAAAMLVVIGARLLVAATPAGLTSR